MPFVSPRGAILDSDTEADRTLPPVATAKNANHTSPPATERGPNLPRDGRATEDSSAEDSEPEAVKPKRGRKPRPKIPAVDAPADGDQSGKHKRFLWSNYRTQEAFLEKQLDYILAAAKQDRRQKKKSAKKKFMEKFGPLGGYSATEFENILNNWLKNRLQFPNLRKAEQNPCQDDDASDNQSPCLATPHSGASTSASRSPELAPLLQMLRRRALGPSGLWAHEHAQEVRKLHMALGGTIGDYKTAVHRLYAPLSAEEKAVWEAKAQEAKDRTNKDDAQCFRNQTDFPLLIANLIAAFFGFNPDQVGSGLAHLRTALRTEDGSIIHDQYTIGLSDGAPSFDLYAGGPKQDEIDRWGQFVDEFLPLNPPKRDLRLTYEADGLPKLPNYNDEWSVAEARSALDAWFQGMWIYAAEHGIHLPHGLDWSNFKTAVAPHVPAHWSDRISGKPSDGAFHRILTLYNDLFEAQGTPHAFQWISSTTSLADPPVPSKDVAPQTPSRRMHTVYTTPTKAIASVRDQAREAQPLPRLVIPSLETIRDEDEIGMGPSSASPVTPGPSAPDMSNRVGSGAPEGTTGSIAAVLECMDGDTERAAASRDTSTSTADSAADLATTVLATPGMPPVTTNLITSTPIEHPAATTLADPATTPTDPAVCADHATPADPESLPILTTPTDQQVVTTPADSAAATTPADPDSVCADHATAATPVEPESLPTLTRTPTDQPAATTPADPAPPPTDLTCADTTTADPASLPCADPDPVCADHATAATPVETESLPTLTRTLTDQPAATTPADPATPPSTDLTCADPTTTTPAGPTLTPPTITSAGSKRKRQTQPPSGETVLRLNL